MNANVAWPVGGVLAALAAWWWVVARRLEVGAWTGLAAIEDPQGTIAIAKRCGVDRLAIFVNDRSFANGGWRTYNRASIVACCQAVQAAGLRVSLVSWMRPTPEWIGDGARDLGRLATECRVDEIDLDLEEPWTVVRNFTDPEIAAISATLFASLRSTFRGRIVVDCIVGTDLRALGPPISLSDGVVPQAYTVATNPPDLERKALAKFKPFGKPVIMGIAGYWRSSPYEPGRPDVLRGVLARCSALGVRRVRVWRLEMLQTPGMAAEVLAWKARKPDAKAVA